MKVSRTMGEEHWCMQAKIALFIRNGKVVRWLYSRWGGEIYSLSSSYTTVCNNNSSLCVCVCGLSQPTKPSVYISSV